MENRNKFLSLNDSYAAFSTSLSFFKTYRHSFIDEQYRKQVGVVKKGFRSFCQTLRTLEILPKDSARSNYFLFGTSPCSTLSFVTLNTYADILYINNLTLESLAPLSLEEVADSLYREALLFLEKGKQQTRTCTILSVSHRNTFTDKDKKVKHYQDGKRISEEKLRALKTLSIKTDCLLTKTKRLLLGGEKVYQYSTLTFNE